jgi:hypothetical protein
VSVVKFPYVASLRLYSRKPRRSKNGTPAERAARVAAEAGEPATVVSMPKASTIPGQDGFAREMRDAIERLDPPDRRFMEGYIRGLVDGRKARGE